MCQEFNAAGVPKSLQVEIDQVNNLIEFRERYGFYGYPHIFNVGICLTGIARFLDHSKDDPRTQFFCLNRDLRQKAIWCGLLEENKKVKEKKMKERKIKKIERVVSEMRLE